MIAELLLAATLTTSGPGAYADTRGTSTNTLHKHLYCVRNAETGACEDYWTDGPVSSARGTCNVLKRSTTAPNVRTGTCSAPATAQWCKGNQR
jgi:hypothetical protein